MSSANILYSAQLLCAKQPEQPPEPEPNNNNQDYFDRCRQRMIYLYGVPYPTKQPLKGSYFYNKQKTLK